MKVMDLFCGAGGSSEGFKQAGFQIVLGLDNDRSACRTFSFNFPEAKVLCEDILSVDERDLPKVDVVMGSPPCVEFSKAGLNRSWDTELIKRYLEIIAHIKPRFYVMENVPEAQRVINPLSGEFAGKFPTQLILCSYDFGCATVRERLFSGRFPRKVQKSRIRRAVRDVINPDTPGYRQPFKTQAYRRIDPNKPLFTICSHRKSNERYLLPNGRSLEVSELAILQGFPPWFIFPCSRSEAQKQIGNSVSPPVSRAIGEAILKAGGDPQ